MMMPSLRRRIMMAQSGEPVGTGVYHLCNYSGYLRTTDIESGWTTITTSFTRGIGVNKKTGTLISCGRFLKRSTDNGLTWTTLFTTSFIFYKVASDDNGNWLAVGASGAIRYSTDDGLTWSAYTVGSTDLTHLAFGSGFFIAISYSSKMIYKIYPESFTTYTSVTSSESFIYSDYNTLSYQNKLFIIPISTLAMISSVDGVTWTTHSVIPSCSSIGRVTYFNGKYYAPGAYSSLDQIWSSTDLDTWVNETSTLSYTRTTNAVISEKDKDGILVGAYSGYFRKFKAATITASRPSTSTCLDLLYW